MTLRTFWGVAVVAAVLLACSKPSAAESMAAPPAVTAVAAITWLHASTDSEVDAAFERARREGKPVFVYWGAAWCPPCNQLKATLFNRADFIERSRAFLPVYVDGDSAGAQKLGTRFKVRGYPTMVLFDPQGREITRLPGEVDAQLYTQVLTLGMSAQRPVKEVLAQARAGGAGLTSNDWKLLAFYSWETDEERADERLAHGESLAALLKQLAHACPPDQTEAAMRLLLKSLAAVDIKVRVKPDRAALSQLLALLADPARSRHHMDVLTNSAGELVNAASAAGTRERSQLLGAFDAALVQLAADATLSRADRLTALIARVDLVRIDEPADDSARRKVAVPSALLKELREHSARADREITDGYERQAVITTAAYALAHAGLLDESDALLQSNLAKSHSPYYLMSELASNAKKRKDPSAALRWYEQAFDTSEGAATRLQWGASYVGALVDLAPKDDARIEKAVLQLWALAEAQPDAFHERSARSMQRVGKRLMEWNKAGAHQAAFTQLKEKLDAVCSRLDSADPQRARCSALFVPAKIKRS